MSLRLTRRRKQSVTIGLQVTAEITDGSVTAQDLTEWVREAIARYHTFRAGHVGLDIVGGIKLPAVDRLEDVDGD